MNLLMGVGARASWLDEAGCVCRGEGEQDHCVDPFTVVLAEGGRCWVGTGRWRGRAPLAETWPSGLSKSINSNQH